MPNLIGQLGLQNSKKFVLIEIGRNITDGHHGCTIPLNGLDSYIISIDMLRLQDIGVTLAHEMVHVKQLAKGLLKAVKGQKDRKSTRLNSSHTDISRMPSSA